MISKKFALGGASGIALLIAAQAHAQAPVASDAAQATSTAAPAAIGEVVVTASKRAERLIDVPSSISVISGTGLQNSMVNQILDYGNSIPGVSISSGGTPGQDRVVIRGITTGDDSGALVGTYIDDVPVGVTGEHGRPSLFSLDLMPYDLDRVEVLRGPQGTLYGASTMGGLLKYVTINPSLNTFEERVGADVSDTEHTDTVNWNIRAEANLPLVEDKLALRVSGFTQNNAGYINDVGLNDKYDNASHQNGGRASLLFQPDPTLQIKAAMMIQSIDANNNAVVTADPTTLKPIYGEYTRSSFTPEPYRDQLNVYTLDINKDFGFANLISATSWQVNRQSSQLDATGFYGPLFPELSGGAVAPGLSSFHLGIDSEKFTQEVRLTSRSEGWLQWVVGAFYTHESITSLQGSSALTLTGQPTAINPLSKIDNPSTYQEVAGFGDLTIKLNDHFDVTGGLRVSHNNQEFNQDQTGTFYPGGIHSTGNSDATVLNYMVSPRFHLNRDTMFYIRVADGYRPGGPNTAFPGTPSSFKSDSLTNYEGGVKTELFDRKLSLDASVYDIEWDNIQITVIPSSGVSFTGNGGRATSRGVEFSSQYTPIHGLNLGATFSYGDAHLDQDVPSLNGLAGDRLPLSPHWNGSLSADYDREIVADWDGGVSASVGYRGDVWSALPHDPTAVLLHPQTIVNGNIHVTHGRYTFKIFAKNLFEDKGFNDVYLYGPTQVDFVPITPRTIGVSVDAKF